MDETSQPTNLEGLLDELEQAGEGRRRVSVGALVQQVGRRSFGPLLLLAGLLAVSPASGIPGMPTTVGVLVMAVAVQFLLGREHVWLPGWVLRRRMSRQRFAQALRVARRPARAVDRVLQPRLTALTRAAGAYVTAALCVLVAATMPPLELVPFAATAAGAALTGFGLALIAGDGLVGLVSMLLTVLVAGLVIHHLV
jgi:hypothetical protein